MARSDLGAAPLGSGVMEAAAVVKAVYRSAQTGRRVLVAEVLADGGE